MPQAGGTEISSPLKNLRQHSNFSEMTNRTDTRKFRGQLSRGVAPGAIQAGPSLIIERILNPDSQITVKRTECLKIQTSNSDATYIDCVPIAPEPAQLIEWLRSAGL
jgi:hypothetical protein